MLNSVVALCRGHKCVDINCKVKPGAWTTLKMYNLQRSPQWKLLSFPNNNFRASIFPCYRLLASDDLWAVWQTLQARQLNYSEGAACSLLNSAKIRGARWHLESSLWDFYNAHPADLLTERLGFSKSQRQKHQCKRSGSPALDLFFLSRSGTIFGLGCNCNGRSDRSPGHWHEFPQKKQSGTVTLLTR